MSNLYHITGTLFPFTKRDLSSPIKYDVTGTITPSGITDGYFSFCFFFELYKFVHSQSANTLRDFQEVTQKQSESCL